MMVRIFRGALVSSSAAGPNFLSGRPKLTCLMMEMMIMVMMMIMILRDTEADLLDDDGDDDSSRD